jgi:hypothetical protein
MPSIQQSELSLSPELSYDQITDFFAGPSIGLIPSSTFGLGQIIVRPIKSQRIQSTLNECERICISYLVDNHSSRQNPSRGTLQDKVRDLVLMSNAGTAEMIARGGKSKDLSWIYVLSEEQGLKLASFADEHQRGSRDDEGHDDHDENRVLGHDCIEHNLDLDLGVYGIL